MNETRSVSQANQYLQCEYQYYLERRFRDEMNRKAWKRSAAWFPQGTALHSAAEAFERSGRTMTLEEVKDVFREVYAADVNRYCEETPNLNYWFPSGPYKGQDDVERRFRLGLEQVERYLAWVAAHPEERIWTTPDGTPGIELEFNVWFGSVLVRGFIDQVKLIDGSEVRVTDLKSGNNPGGIFQLAVYAHAINEQYGTEITTGEYWMGKTGKPSRKQPFTFEEWPKDRVIEVFETVDEGIRAGRFEPNPGDQCSRCTVETSCPFSAVKLNTGR